MILSEIEDKSYFERKTTYNFLSREFVKYKINEKRMDYNGKMQKKIGFLKTGNEKDKQRVELYSGMFPRHNLDMEKILYMSNNLDELK